MSSSVRGMPGGQPSITQPMAGPWLSPQVVTLNRWPNVLWDIERPYQSQVSVSPSIMSTLSCGASRCRISVGRKLEKVAANASAPFRNGRQRWYPMSLSASQSHDRSIHIAVALPLGRGLVPRVRLPPRVILRVARLDFRPWSGPPQVAEADFLQAVVRAVAVRRTGPFRRARSPSSGAPSRAGSPRSRTAPCPPMSSFSRPPLR